MYVYHKHVRKKMQLINNGKVREKNVCSSVFHKKEIMNTEKLES